MRGRRSQEQNTAGSFPRGATPVRAADLPCPSCAEQYGVREGIPNQMVLVVAWQ